MSRVNVRLNAALTAGLCCLNYASFFVWLFQS
jgi:hypothetical protein